MKSNELKVKNKEEMKYKQYKMKKYIFLDSLRNNLKNKKIIKIIKIKSKLNKNDKKKKLESN